MGEQGESGEFTRGGAHNQLDLQTNKKGPLSGRPSEPPAHLEQAGCEEAHEKDRGGKDFAPTWLAATFLSPVNLRAIKASSFLVKPVHQEPLALEHPALCYSRSDNMGKTRGHRGSQHTYKKHQASKASLKYAKVEVHRENRTAVRSELAHANRINGPEDMPSQRKLY